MKKNFKRILAAMMTVILLLTAAPIGEFAGMDLTGLNGLFSVKTNAEDTVEYIEGVFKYTISNNAATITGTVFEKNYIESYVGSIEVPSTIGGYPVKIIGDLAFKGFKKATSLTIPDGVEKICAGAFYRWENLKTLVLPDSITYIDDLAFAYCYSLEFLHLPSNLVSLQGGVFLKAQSLKELYIPNSLSEISFDVCVVGIGMGCDSPFSDSGLTNITFENGRKKIPFGLFENCSKIESIFIPDSIEFVGAASFRNCTNLETVTGMKNVKVIEDLAFSNCSNLRNMPRLIQLESLGSGSFYNTGNLDEFYIPKSLTNCNLYYNIVGIGSGSKIGPFKYSGIAAITFEDEISSITDGLFMDATKLERISIPSSITTIGVAAFMNCTSLIEVYGIEKVTKISDLAFYNCSSLKEINLSENLNYLGAGSFANTTSLEKIFIPKTISKVNTYYSFVGIGSKTMYPFSNSGLLDVTFEKGLAAIPNYLFNNCKNLTVLTFPNSINTVGKSSFGNCESLTDVYFQGSETEWNEINIADGNDSLLNATIHFNGSGGTSEGMYNIYAFSSKPQLILGTADSIEMRFEIDCYDFNNPAYLLPEPTFSFTTSDTNIFKIESIKNNGGNTSIGITGENPGTAILTVTGYNNGEYVAEGHFLITVTGESVYHADAMPKFDDYNIIANNIIIDKFKCENTGTETCNISFEAYNQMNCFGSVEVYDKDNNLLESHCLDRFGLGLPTGWWDTAKQAFDVTCYKDRSYKDADCSTKTEVELIAVPRDGRIVISNDPQSSLVCAIYNMSYLLADICCQAVTMALSGDSADEACNNIAVAVAKETMDILFSNASLLGQFKEFSKSFFTSTDYGNREKIEKSVEFYSIFISEVGVDVGEIAIEILKQSLMSVPVALIEKAINTVFGPVGAIMKVGFSFISFADTADMIETLSKNCGVGNVSIYCSLPWNEELFSNGYMVRGQEPFEGKTSFHQYKIVDKKTYDEATDTFGTEKYIDVVEMSLYQNGEKVQPKGTVEVAIPLPKGIKFMNVRIYRKEEDGTYTKINCNVENGYIYINTEHFSVYCIVADCVELEKLNFENDYILLNVDQAVTQLPTRYPEDSIETELVWSSSDEEVAVVTPMGNVVGLNPGIAEIYVSTVNGDIYASYTVEVVNSISIYLDTNYIEMKYKDSTAINPVISVDEGVNYTVTYTSSNPSVATVDENGNVYGAKKGSADITVTVTDEYGNSASDTCTVQVKYSFWQWIIKILLFGWIWY